MDIPILKTRAEMAALAVRLEQAGTGWYAPLIRKAMADQLRLLILPPGGQMQLSLLDMRRHPLPLVVILAGNDTDPAGPGHFPQAHRLMRWARALIVHGTEGHPFHYEFAAEAARTHGRVLMVETATAYLGDWIAFKSVVAPNTPGLIVAPPDGHHHPSEGVPAGTVLQ
jgi:hypothetical protein